MRTATRLTALAVAVVGLVFWLFGGPNLGWTRNRVPVTRKDPVTEIEYIEWQRNFVPGVDFLGGCAGLAGVVWGVSWLLPGRNRGSGWTRPGAAEIDNVKQDGRSGSR